VPRKKIKIKKIKKAAFVKTTTVPYSFGSEPAPLTPNKGCVLVLPFALKKKRSYYKSNERLVPEYLL